MSGAYNTQGPLIRGLIIPEEPHAGVSNTPEIREVRRQAIGTPGRTVSLLVRDTNLLRGAAIGTRRSRRSRRLCMACSYRLLINAQGCHRPNRRISHRRLGGNALRRHLITVGNVEQEHSKGGSVVQGCHRPNRRISHRRLGGNALRRRRTAAWVQKRICPMEFRTNSRTRAFGRPDQSTGMSPVLTGGALSRQHRRVGPHLLKRIGRGFN